MFIKYVVIVGLIANRSVANESNDSFLAVFAFATIQTFRAQTRLDSTRLHSDSAQT